MGETRPSGWERSLLVEGVFGGDVAEAREEYCRGFRRVRVGFRGTVTAQARAVYRHYGTTRLHLVA